jgi:adenosylcobinamide-phosphate synthase
VDDVLSWLPARLTALLLCLAGRRWPGWAHAREQAQRTPSPNGGWPMGVTAWLLGCRLSKPGVYVLNEPGLAPEARHHAQALRWAGQVVGMLTWLTALSACLATLAG